MAVSFLKIGEARDTHADCRHRRGSRRGECPNLSLPSDGCKKAPIGKQVTTSQVNKWPQSVQSQPVGNQRFQRIELQAQTRLVAPGADPVQGTFLPPSRI